MTLVVTCPPGDFNATFYLPHRALAGRRRGNNSINNRTFLVSLNDSAQTLHVFLTAVQLPLGVHREHAHGPSSQATRRDAETLYRVLLTAFVSLFCCLVILSALMLTYRPRCV